MDNNLSRNIGISAHIDAGKTTLTERILYYSGVNYKIGEVHEGKATMDWLPQEKERGITINSACTTVFWKNKKINIIDTPGHVDFTIEVERTMRVIDSVCLIYCAVSGVQAQSETVWKQSIKYKTPKLIFINKMDRLGADYYKVFNQIRKLFSDNIVPIYLPYFLSSKFVGLIDLLEFKIIIWDDFNKGEKYSYDKIPNELIEESNYWRNFLIEKSISDNDFYIEKYLNKEELSIDLINCIIKKKTLLSKLIPVTCGSALKNKGVQSFLDSIINYLPEPNEFNFILSLNNKKSLQKNLLIIHDKFIALSFKIINDDFIGQLVFFRIYSGIKKTGDIILNSSKNKKEKISRILKIHANNKLDIEEMKAGDIVAVTGLKYTFTGDTICDLNENTLLENISIPKPVISQSIDVLFKKDQDKLFNILYKINKEDPSFIYSINSELNQIIISGMGELHLEIIIDKIKRDYNINIITNKPKVSFKETIKSESLNIEGKYIRQSGGRGNYGHVIINVEPSERGSGNKFINKIKSGSIPKEYILPIEKSIKDTLNSGIFGYEVIDINIYLIDGSYHEVDSNENSFKIAASLALKTAILKSNPIVLEPIMIVNIETPEEYIGVIVNDIISKRGLLLDVLDYNDFKLINCKIPLCELFGYSTTLRSFTKGRAIYNMTLFNYSEINREYFLKIK